MYDTWLIFRPAISHYITHDWIVDQYGNVSREDTDDTFYQESHISEPDTPNSLPSANGILFAARYLIIAPQQSKYTTELRAPALGPRQIPGKLRVSALTAPIASALIRSAVLANLGYRLRSGRRSLDADQL